MVYLFMCIVLDYLFCFGSKLSLSPPPPEVPIDIPSLFFFHLLVFLHVDDFF
jgi:hypothetical protein